MALSKLAADGEAWEMRFQTVAIAPGRAKSRLKRITAALHDAFNLIGNDGMLDPFADNWHTENWYSDNWGAGS